MSLGAKQKRVLEAMAANEVSIGQLYRVYAAKYPDYKDFWSGLADDELEHASKIRELAAKVEAGSLNFKEGRFKPEAIETFLKYLERELKKAEEQEMPLINALSTALYIEESLTERKYFEVFDGDSPAVKRTLLYLNAATEKHLDKVRQLWSQNR